MGQWRDLLNEKIQEANIIIAGIPYDKACSCNKGARFAPNKIRKLSSFLPPATKEGESIASLKVYDIGNIGTNKSSFKGLEDSAKNIFEFNKFPIFIGGDHSVSIPIQKAFFDYCKSMNKIPAIIHIDAHPDFCDIYDGSKYSHACTNFRAMENGYKFEDIVLLAIRGYEIQEINLFNEHKEIKIIPASKIIEKGLDAVKELKNKFDDKYAVYLSFDVDAIDPAYAPGTGTPEAFGITSKDANEIINYFVANLPVKAMDIVEVSPPLDVNDMTSWTVLKILYEVFNTILKKQNH